MADCFQYVLVYLIIVELLALWRSVIQQLFFYGVPSFDWWLFINYAFSGAEMNGLSIHVLCLNIFTFCFSVIFSVLTKRPRFELTGSVSPISSCPLTLSLVFSAYIRPNYFFLVRLQSKNRVPHPTNMSSSTFFSLLLLLVAIFFSIFIILFVYPLSFLFLQMYDKFSLYIMFYFCSLLAFILFYLKQYYFRRYSYLFDDGDSKSHKRGNK